MLHCFEKEESLTNSWRYRLFIGKLNYLEKSTSPDFSYAVHPQCARFCKDPKMSRTQAVEHIDKYLMGKKDEGIFIQPDKTSSIDVYIDCWKLESINSRAR